MERRAFQGPIIEDEGRRVKKERIDRRMGVSLEDALRPAVEKLFADCQDLRFSVKDREIMIVFSGENDPRYAKVMRVLGEGLKGYKLMNYDLDLVRTDYPDGRQEYLALF